MTGESSPPEAQTAPEEPQPAVPEATESESKKRKAEDEDEDGQGKYPPTYHFSSILLLLQVLTAFYLFA